MRAAQATLLAQQDAVTPLLAVGTQCVLNIVGDWYLVVHRGGGLPGAAWATVISQVRAMRAPRLRGTGRAGSAVAAPGRSTRRCPAWIMAWSSCACVLLQRFGRWHHCCSSACCQRRDMSPDVAHLALRAQICGTLVILVALQRRSKVGPPAGGTGSILRARFAPAELL